MHSLRKMDERKQWMLDSTETVDHFNGLCLGVDSMEELEQFAKHWNTTVNPSDNPDPAAHFQRASGYILPMASTPSGKRGVDMDEGPAKCLLLSRSPHPLRSATTPVRASMVRPTGIRVGRVGEKNWTTGSAYRALVTCLSSSSTANRWECGQYAWGPRSTMTS